MKNRVLFLRKEITFFYPKFDPFELLKEICLQEPVFQSDKLYFYEFMKKYISESNNTTSTDSKEHKISLFNMLTEENKSEITLSQFNLYIELFCDINKEKELFLMDDNQNDEYNIIIDYDINIEDIFGINDLWNLLFELKEEELSRKLINILYNIYKNKEETQKIIDKCINIIKDIDNISFYNI